MYTKEKLLELLNNPIVSDQMPKEFNRQIEAEHLLNIINKNDTLKSYRFERFINAGGSGLLFKVKRKVEEDFYTAVKISLSQPF